MDLLSSVLALRASSGVAARSRWSRFSSSCSPRIVSIASSLRDLRTGRLGSVRLEYSGPRWARSSAISSAARRDGASGLSSWSTVTPRIRASFCSSPSLSSRLPFSMTDTCDAARPSSAPRSSRVRPRSVRSCRMRRPTVRESSMYSSCSAFVSFASIGGPSSVVFF